MTYRLPRLTLAAGIGLVAATTSNADIIDNGTVQLGINDQGNLVQSGIGLTFLPSGGEALAPGCPCEGWGIADVTTGAFGMAGESFGDANLGPATLTVTGTGTDPASTGDSAMSEVTVTDGTFQVDVTHEYTPSASDNLYQVDVTMTNMGTDDIGDLVYRRAMDWDVPPTEFSEFVTIQGWPATKLIHSSDDGFTTGNPNVPLTAISGDSVVDGNFTNSGPADHGAAFDFSFGTVAAGVTEAFTIFYGAAASEADALIALADVGAEVYSLGKPSSPDGEELGVPNTFIFAFAGVGGTPVGGTGLGAALSPLADLAYLDINHHLNRVATRLDQLSLGRIAAGAVVSSQGATTSINGLTLHFAGSYQNGSVAGTANNVGLDYQSNYFGLTADYEISGGTLFERALVGAAVAYESIDSTRVDGLGSIDGEVTTVSFYAGGSNADGLFGDAQLFYSDLSFSQQRIGTTATFSSSPQGNSVGARLRAGYNFGPKMLQMPQGTSGILGVYGELTYANTNIDQFTENNGGVTTSAFSYDSAVLALGTRFAYEARRPEGMMFANIDLAVMQDLAASDFTVTQTTAGGAVTTVNVDGRDEVMGRVSAAVGMEMNSNWTGAIEVGAQFGDNYIDEVSVGLRVGMTF